MRRREHAITNSLRLRLGELNHNYKLCILPQARHLAAMSTVREIEAAIPKLSQAELEEFRVWFENYVENHLELTEEVKAKLDQSRREIAAGNYTTRHSK